MKPKAQAEIASVIDTQLNVQKKARLGSGHKYDGQSSGDNRSQHHCHTGLNLFSICK